ncbi:efflux RND transporter periplasmic adaptor subunit [Halobacillus sp. Marseille-P3879]|uniref:efflux RND transporter periplasmic adaptor subunit n=1 Tax=Halobacillus sp. Marseille-P3879 TaxID=2045014 RepID=UPI000C7BAA15|nr:efflux RND transporter periplasmic adaptor subunit [Halobacillus sp. Marseille-P3879]
MKRTILSLLLITTATLTACNNNDNSEPEERTTPVETAEVTQEDFTIERKIAGRAAADDGTPVTPSIAGELVTLNVAKGDRIEEGETVGVVSPADQGSQVELQEIAVRQAQSQLDDARTQYDQAVEGVETAEEQVELARQASGSETEQTIEQAREQFESAQQIADETKKLADEGSVPESIYEQAQERADQAEAQFNQASDQDKGGMSSSAVAEAEAQVEQAEQAVSQAESAVEQAELGVEQAQIQLEDAREQSENEAVIASESGEVASVEASEGDQVSNQQPFATIISLNPITLTASITDEQLSLFEEGQELDIEIPTLDETVTATIDYVPSVPDDTNLYPVEATVDNPEENIKPGMMASFLLPENVLEETLIVPSNAVVEQSGESYVYVVSEDENEVERVDIEINESQSDRTAISGDVSPGDMVVTNGQLTLDDGAKIEVMKEDD